MRKRRYFECKICKNEFISIGDNDRVRCSQCTRTTRANSNTWSIERSFKCFKSNCEREHKSDDFGRLTLVCDCGINLGWKPDGGQIHRFYYCGSCDKEYESLEYRQTQINCPNVDCNQFLNEEKSKTKYYGKLFGQYQCTKKDCKNKWTSAYAFEDFYQKCLVCQKRTYPYDLIEHDRTKPKAEGVDKQHEKDYCQRCKLGLDCAPKRIFNQ